jgi:acetyl esterase
MTHDLELAAIEQARRALRALLALPGSRASGLQKVEDVEIAGPAGPLPARLYVPPDSEGAPLFLYFHGGGFVVGDIETHDGMTSYLAQAACAPLVSVGYRRAPENPFPAQLDDARAAARWALANTERFAAAPDKIVLCGDSAGAYLAARCALELNAAAPGAVPLQVLFYPLVHMHDALWADE